MIILIVLPMNKIIYDHIINCDLTEKISLKGPFRVYKFFIDVFKTFHKNKYWVAWLNAAPA